MEDTVIAITVTTSPSEPATTIVVVAAPTARAVGSVLVHGLELSRLLLLLCERVPSDGHITTRIDERWYGPSPILYEDADGTGVLDRQSDGSCVDRASFSQHWTASGRPKA